MDFRSLGVLVVCVLCLAGGPGLGPALVASDLQVEDQGQSEVSLNRYVKDQVDSALVPLYDMSNYFINSMVQPRLLTEMEDKGANLSSWETTYQHLQEHWQDWALHYVGYATCVAVGVVLFLTMLLVALIAPCCRCCGNCGGKVDPRQSKHDQCKRVSCGCALFIITLVIVLGVVCLFVLNLRFKDTLQGEESIFDSVSSTVLEVDAFLDETTEELNTTALGGFTETKNRIFRTLDNIPSDSLHAIDNATRALANFDSLADVGEALPQLNTSLTQASEELNELHTQNSDFRSHLTAIVEELNMTISECASEACTNVSASLAQLTTAGDFYNMTIEVTAAAGVVTAILGDGSLIDDIGKINETLDDLESKISETIQDPIDAAKDVADQVENEVKKFVSDLDQAVEDLDLSSLNQTMADVKEDVQFPADVLYWVIFGLAAVLGFICLCNLLGLLHDATCSRKKHDETDCCSCDKSLGAHWLLTGVAFTFIFYWILTLIVAVMFLGGGMVQSEVCRHIVNYNDSSSMEVLDIYESWLEQEVPDLQNISIMASYSNCEQNQAVYTALSLENQVNISAFLNLTDVENAINEIKNINVTLDNVTLMTPELNSTLTDLDYALTLDFNGFYAELNEPLTTVSVAELLEDLRKLLGDPDIDNTTLLDQTEELEQLYGNYSLLLGALKTASSSHLETAEGLLEGMSLSSLSSDLSQSEDALNSQGSHVTNTFISDTADTVYSDIEGFVHDIEEDVRYNIGKCRQLYDSLTSSIDAGCVQALWAVNGFWFSLGWCLFFLLPSIILSFKLTTLYRKTLPYKSALRPEDDPLYDAYKSNPRSTGDHPNEMLLNPMARGAAPRGRDMYAIDNPVFQGDRGEPDLHLPRPQLMLTKEPSHLPPGAHSYTRPGYPHYDRYSPPPKYRDQY